MEQQDGRNEPKPEPTLDQVYEKFPWIKEGLAALREHDQITFDHSLRVARLTWLLSENKGINEKQRLTLYAAGLAHDLGKTATPEPILNKPGKLTDEEFGEMQLHVRYSVDMIRNWEDREVEFDDVVIDELVEAHHWFGKSRYGNPPSEHPQVRRLQLFLAASDYADALLSPRPYKEAQTVENATGFAQEDYPQEEERRVVTDTLKLREGMKREE